MAIDDPGDDLEAGGFGDDFMDSIDTGGYADLPFEMPDADAGDVNYADLPETEYDPDADWRDKQMQHVKNKYGEFAPGDAPEHQEATDG